MKFESAKKKFKIKSKQSCSRDSIRSYIPSIFSKVSLLISSPSMLIIEDINSVNSFFTLYIQYISGSLNLVSFESIGADSINFKIKKIIMQLHFI